MGAVLLMGLIGGTAHADPVSTVKQKIARIVDHMRLARSQVGIYARVTESGRVLFARNPDSPMIPASNFKLLTTSTALAVLGPDFRFTTEVLGPPVASGTINGNLYLRGNGDPTLVYPWTRSATGPFEAFATALRKQGVRSVSGALVGDDSAFDRDFIGKGWLRRYILCDYAAETAALSINGNVMSLDVRPDKVTSYPPTTALHVRRISSRGGFLVTRSMNSSEVIVQNCKPGKQMQTSMTIHNPSEYTTGVFLDILRHDGISFGQPMRLVNDDELPLPQGYVRYAVHQSAPLLKIIKRINKHSDNLFADHVFKAVGWRRYGKGTLETSTRAVKEFLASIGVDTRGIEIADGCGLSVLNHVSPHQFVQLLEGMSRRPEFLAFRSTLPEPGKEGTLGGRLIGLPVHAKTGTIDGTCTLSGYVTTRAGQQVCFSILVNHHHLSNDSIRWMQDEIVKSIAAIKVRI
jgi:D-alanyl-D-alanine carboxypeptidase/D-alanyl-D-alanine-endopeptidase (penicillin-binding protein 4)